MVYCLIISLSDLFANYVTGDDEDYQYETEEERTDRHRDIEEFGTANIRMIVFIELAREAVMLAQGLMMVKAAIVVIRHIRRQERNPEYGGEKFGPSLYRYEKIIAFLIVVNLVIQVCNGYYYFVVMDNYLSEKY